MLDQNRRRLLLCSAALSGLAGAAPALAATRYWNGFITNYYTTALNWESGVAPIAADTAVFDASEVTQVFRSNVILDDIRTITSFRVNENGVAGTWLFTREGTGSLTITNAFQMVGTFSATSTSTFSGFQIGMATGSLSIDTASVTFSNGTTVTTPSASLAQNARFAVSTSTLTVNGPLSIGSFNIASISTVGRINANRFSLGSTSDLLVDSTSSLNLTAAGTSTISAGTLTLSGNGLLLSSGHTVQTSSAGLVSIGSSYALPNNTGMIADSGGDISVNGFFDVGNGGIGTLSVSGPGSSAVSLTGLSDWGFGAAGRATLSFSSGGLGSYAGLRIGGSGGVATTSVTSNAQVTVTGSLSVAGSGTLNQITLNQGLLSASGTALFGNGAAISVVNGGTLSLLGDSTFASGSALSVDINSLFNLGGNRTVTMLGTGTIQGNQIVKGTLALQNTGQLNVLGRLEVGNPGVGTMIVNGPSARLTTGQTLDIGRFNGSPGQLAISSSGVGTVTGGMRLADFGGQATLTLSGGGSRLTTGTLLSGGTLASGAATINISDGTLSVLGAASFLSSTQINLTGGTLSLGPSTILRGNTTLTVGSGGNLRLPGAASLSLQNGAAASFAFPYVLANNARLSATDGGKIDFFDTLSVDSATISISGAGSRLTMAGGLIPEWAADPGESVTATFDGGAVGTLSNLRVGTSGGGGRLDVLNGSTLTIGRLRSGSTGVGGGSVVINVGTSSVLNNTLDAVFNSNTTLNVSGGAVALGSSLFATGNSAVNWTGGTIVLGTGKNLTLQNSSLLGTAGQPLELNATRLTIDSGTFTLNNYLDVGVGSGGTLSVRGAGALFSVQSESWWGQGTSGFADVVIGGTPGLQGPGGSVNLDRLRTGFDGGTAWVEMLDAGSMTVNAGTLSSDLTTNGSSTTITMQPGSQLTFQNAAQIAGANPATFNLNGGTLRFAGQASVGTLGTVNLLGGSSALVVDGSTTFAGSSTLNWSSGTIVLGPDATLHINGATITSSSSKSGMGTGGTLLINNGGQFSSPGHAFSFGTSNSGTFTTGTLIVDGPGTNMQLGGGTGSVSSWFQNANNSGFVTFSNQATGILQNAALAAFGGFGRMDVLSQSTVQTNGFEIGSVVNPNAVAQVNVDNATLAVAGLLTVFRGGAIDVTGGGTLSISSIAQVSPGGSLNITPTGTLLLAGGGRLSVIGGAGTFATGLGLGAGQTLRVSSGGSVYTPLEFSMGSGASTLEILDAGSALRVMTSAGSISQMGATNATVTRATFRDGGVGTFAGALRVGPEGTTTIDLQNAGQLVAHGLDVGASAGSAVVNIDGGILTSTSGMRVDANSTVNFNSGGLRVGGGSLSVTGNGRVNVAPTGGTKVVAVPSLHFSGTGRLDLSNNGMVVDYDGATPAGGIRSSIQAGRAGGAWSGNALTSSSAAENPSRFGVGYAEASDLGSPTSFLGQPLADNTAILIRYTLVGDNNLDGAVDIGDFAGLAASFNLATDQWSRGDYNYDGTTGIADFALLAANFNQTLPAPLPRGSAVPEPATGVVVAGLVVLLARRRRAGAV